MRSGKDHIPDSSFMSDCCDVMRLDDLRSQCVDRRCLSLLVSKVQYDSVTATMMEAMMFWRSDRCG